MLNCLLFWATVVVIVKLTLMNSNSLDEVYLFVAQEGALLHADQQLKNCLRSTLMLHYFDRRHGKMEVLKKQFPNFSKHAHYAHFTLLKKVWITVVFERNRRF